MGRSLLCVGFLLLLLAHDTRAGAEKKLRATFERLDGGKITVRLAETKKTEEYRLAPGVKVFVQTKDKAKEADPAGANSKQLRSGVPIIIHFRANDVVEAIEIAGPRAKKD